MMSSFHEREFQSFSTPELSLGDIRLCTVPTNEYNGVPHVPDFYPEIHSTDIFHGPTDRSRDSRRTVMVAVSEHLVKRVVRTFFEEGLIEALNEAKRSRNPSNNIIISSFADYALRLVEISKRVKFFFLPYLREQGTDNISRYSEVRSWHTSPIRYIRWHPNCFKIAVATVDDVIRVYTDETAVVPILKSWTQKGVTSMAWRPFSATELAVGCQSGILLWSVDPYLHTSRPLSQAVQLQHPNHSPVTSVEWSPNGCLLATSSISDADVLIWDVDQSTNTPLKRVGPPCSLLKWSPDGYRLLSSTVGNVFREWTTDKWVPERWTIASGYIQSAAWSPCGSYLLFVTSDEFILYRLQFVEEELFATATFPKEALPIADLSQITIANKEVGGKPQSISWDPNGYYLAIMFKDSPCIVIFTTTIKKNIFNISPACFVSGQPGEYPTFVCFQNKNRKNSGSVLTIAWSSGRVEYFPIVNI